MVAELIKAFLFLDNRNEVELNSCNTELLVVEFLIRQLVFAGLFVFEVHDSLPRRSLQRGFITWDVKDTTSRNKKRLTKQVGANDSVHLLDVIKRQTNKDRQQIAGCTI